MPAASAAKIQTWLKAAAPRARGQSEETEPRTGERSDRCNREGRRCSGGPQAALRRFFADPAHQLNDARNGVGQNSSGLSRTTP